MENVTRGGTGCTCSHASRFILSIKQLHNLVCMSFSSFIVIFHSKSSSSVIIVPSKSSSFIIIVYIKFSVQLILKAV